MKSNPVLWKSVEKLHYFPHPVVDKFFLYLQHFPPLIHKIFLYFFYY